MKIQELLQTNANTLQRKQFKALKKHVLTILKSISISIEMENFNKLMKEHTKFSLAGDGMGADHYFINFRFTNKNKEDEGDDIGDVIRKLIELRQGS